MRVLPVLTPVNLRNSRQYSVLVGRLIAYAARVSIWMEYVRPIHMAAEYVPDVMLPPHSSTPRVSLR